MHTSLHKNKRQPYAVSAKAGHQTSAESWGTGRAVARVPRVGGGGTHRAGQGAFANFCRGGRMFAPTKVWRKWHVKIDVGAKTYAVASAMAATGVTSLVLARGHKIEAVSEIPLVIDDALFSSVHKTKAAVNLLKTVNAAADVLKVEKSRALRASKGKMRNRRWRQRRGPLIVHNGDEEIDRCFRNIRGVETMDVKDLDLLQLAPGGHVGRFIIWTTSAFKHLDEVFGTVNKPATSSSSFVLPRSIMTNPDLKRLIESDEIQRAVKPRKDPELYPRRQFKADPYEDRVKQSCHFYCSIYLHP